jgi:hypothetical protein
MIFIYIIIATLLLILTFKSLDVFLKRKVISKAQAYGIKDTYEIKGVSYKVTFLHVPMHAKLQVNSKTVIQIKKGKDVTLVPFELTKANLIITYPSTEKMCVVLNENEIQFFEPSKKIYETYVCPIDRLKSFIEGLHD